MNAIANHLVAIYGEEIAPAISARLAARLDDYRSRIPTPHTTGLSERDAILICYGDQVCDSNTPPLQTLSDFCTRYLSGVISGIHLLPFYPYSSDDGFSVIDYREINPSLGTWTDVERFSRHFRLMFDAVFNHISAQSDWFQRFLRDEPKYRDYFITAPEGADLSRVVRPRTSPLLTQFRTPTGDKKVWTTFSADQIDLNYKNPEVLLEIIDTLLAYVSHGAEIIRLDAVLFLWKEFGTTCVHLPQTHRIIQLFRAVLNEIAPHVALITETNTLHRDNLSYFGDGLNESQMVYNFALSPLVLHTFHTGRAEVLSRWAASLSLPSKRATLFNCLSVHDGIGLNPARGILRDAEIDALVEKALAHGGFVSYKNNPDGTASPYELNINYFDALSNPDDKTSRDEQVDRFIAAQAIMLSFAGVPGIYFHSLFGSRGWREGVTATGRNRTINREKCDRATLERELSDRQSQRYHVFTRYVQLLKTRAAHRAFDPYGEQRIPDFGVGIFAVLRIAPDGTESVLCLHNVTNQICTMSLTRQDIQMASGELYDLLTGTRLTGAREHGIRLQPFQVLWLANRAE